MVWSLPHQSQFSYICIFVKSVVATCITKDMAWFMSHFSMQACYVSPLESLHLGDTTQYTQSMFSWRNIYLYTHLPRAEHNVLMSLIVEISLKLLKFKWITQEMPQARSTVFTRLQKKKRWGINNGKLTSHMKPQTQRKTANRGTAFERTVGNLLCEGGVGGAGLLALNLTLSSEL